MWPEVRLVEVLRLDLDSVPVDAATTYPMVGVLSFGRGLFEREPIENGRTSYRVFYRLKPEHVVMSQLFGWEGALALSSEKFAGKFLSPQFPTFLCDPTRLDRSFLGWFIRRSAFWEALSKRASGMGDRRRTLNPDALLGCQIPLPPLAEQRRVVARIEELAGHVHEARLLRGRATEEAAALVATARFKYFGGIDGQTMVGDVCTVIDPNPSHRYPAYSSDGVPMISSSEFIGRDGIDWSRAKRVSQAFYVETLGRLGVGDGDVIFSRKGKVGYARLHPPSTPLAMTHTLCVLKPDQTQIDPRFLLHIARSPGFLQELLSTMNPNLGVPTLGLNVVREARIPVPSLAEQRSLVARLDAIQAEVDALEALQTETAAELDALLPSILDRAFRGELV
jgi:type I restriction enzyme S subunit